MKQDKSLETLYQLSYICNDNLPIVAFFLSVISDKTPNKIINDLENMRVKKYEDDLNYLLDNLKIGTIKNILSIHTKATQ